jgi:hypothetical protein
MTRIKHLYHDFRTHTLTLTHTAACEESYRFTHTEEAIASHTEEAIASQTTHERKLWFFTQLNVCRRIEYKVIR